MPAPSSASVPTPGTVPTPATVPTAGPLLPRTGAALAAGLAAVAGAALVLLLVVAPDGLRSSADPGAPTVPYWHLLLPTAVALVLVRVLPPRAPTLAPVIAPGGPGTRRVVVAVAALLTCAAAFPVVVAATDVAASAAYHLVKIVVVVALPGLVVLATRGSLRTAWPRAAWRWWAPAVVVLVWTALAQAAPWLRHADYSAYPTDLLVAAAVATALTAGVGEELLYRVWLQTRLEALLGRWGGIAVAALVFALMHVGSRHGQGPLVEVAGAVVVQGLTLGVVAGYLWSRYRNAWLTVALHVLANGYVVAAALLD
ncbi:CPBP family intramembrane glutamic endopeptidase [Cellulomonas sp. S1-8]|uniref:CPBP family intramembrane glutamic endopeptidase n=1 Tax=Cellulomonas sp. S1-8 TaxID=2904790 RepID=UPI002244729B|nr:CPBP family intramembrane glutamic endopeptidase [Cellulomonas sp. S1-8]UZN03006.1 CPBP family intramembrane metalloprotease [Cellulomonas sp. S1-8]